MVARLLEIIMPCDCPASSRSSVIAIAQLQEKSSTVIVIAWLQKKSSTVIVIAQLQEKSALLL